jgi:heme-degrading monooxygenase HmoA
MILEVAQIDVRAGTAPDFESSIEQAVKLLHAAPGFQGVEVLRSIEVPDRYRLLVKWDCVQSHTDGFQKSSAFQQWRRLIGEFFERTPAVEHMEFLVQQGATR